ncbi:FKBP-type peptidyl-prolyl cis-trans isomerase [Nocardioides aequoreus]|uniref:FKBP-type peptidyl-prolyl cis-trans isomerase n=1 Tax=Nocardioides aequoreus TaxID=397278 RepID=UPI0004C40D62|nr:FKBP-type peptidyl-prolyl cis-trans isomerase [Nocardioides aequoreus]
MTRRHRTAALTAALTLLLPLAACGGGGDDAPEESPEATEARDAVTVSGDFGTAPEVEIDAPLELEESASWEETAGEGDEVTQTATTILQLTFYNGTSGEQAISTYDNGQPLEVPVAQLFPSLSEALVGSAAGSRVVVASTAEDAYGEEGSPQLGIEAGDPVVMVADVVSTDPTSVLEAPEGKETPAPEGAPTIVEQGGAPASFDFTGRPPRRLQAYTLVEGEGPRIENPERVTAHYLGQVWGGDEPFDSSYERGEPSTFSVGLSVVEGWSRGLEGVREGSRVMLVIPPRLGYGDEDREGIPAGSTLVFVIDVLGVG